MPENKDSIYDEEFFCEDCGNAISGDEADTYCGKCKHCYQNEDEE